MLALKWEEGPLPSARLSSKHGLFEQILEQLRNAENHSVSWDITGSRIYARIFKILWGPVEGRGKNHYICILFVSFLSAIGKRLFWLFFLWKLHPCGNWVYPIISQLWECNIQRSKSLMGISLLSTRLHVVEQMEIVHKWVKKAVCSSHRMLTKVKENVKIKNTSSTCSSFQKPKISTGHY